MADLDNPPARTGCVMHQDMGDGSAGPGSDTRGRLFGRRLSTLSFSHREGSRGGVGARLYDDHDQRGSAPNRLLRPFSTTTPLHPLLYEKKGRSRGWRGAVERELAISRTATPTPGCDAGPQRRDAAVRTAPVGGRVGPGRSIPQDRAAGPAQMITPVAMPATKGSAAGGSSPGRSASEAAGRPRSGVRRPEARRPRARRRHSSSAVSTTFLASSWTTARLSAPLKDSA